MIYPLKVLQIETTNICNAKCVFCIHSKLKKFGTMSDKLFLKILNHAREIPSIKIIVPMLLGEPFCDDIINRLKQINKILPDKKIVIFTNGSLLNPKIIKQLDKIKNLEMWFSLNGTAETRKKLMGLDDYDYVVKMINLYKITGKPFQVSYINHPDITEEIKEFKKEIKKYDWKIAEVFYKNFSGDIFEGCRQTYCKRAISQMTIMYDGQVNLCCMEEGKVIFGDVKTSSIKKIWESPHRQMYCEAHSKGKYLLGVCENCTKA